MAHPNPQTSALFDAFSWASTPLGHPSGWPAELRTLARLMLRSASPQHIVWGRERILLYNDGYIPVLGHKHPHAFGQRFGQVFPEVWAEIEPIVDRTYGGEASYFEDHPLILNRGDHPQQAWISFAYTPVEDDDGHVLGFHCTFHETTEAVLAAQGRQREIDRLRAMFEQAPGFIALLAGTEHRFALTNPAFRRLVGRQDLIGRTVSEALPETVEQGFVGLLDEVYRSGKPYVGSRVPIDLRVDDNSTERRIVDFVYQPTTDETGAVSGIFIEGVDVTTHAHAEEELHEMTQSALASAKAAEHERLRLDALLEAAPVGIAYADATGRLVVANQENRRIWGGHPLSSGIEAYGEWKAWWADGSERHGHPLEPNDWGLARALRGERVPGDVLEIEPLDAPGTRRTVLVRATPVAGTSEAIAGAVVMQVDITDQVQAREALRASEARFRTITDAMPQMVWSTRADGYADYFNRQWHEFLGTQPDQDHGHAWTEALHPDDRELTLSRWRHSMETGELHEVECRLRHHSGEYRWVLARGLPVRDDAGIIIRWMGTSTEIHERKLVEATLFEREASLRDADRRKDEFLAMLAHELRNPLAPISTAAALLAAPSATPALVQRASQIIGRQVGHITELVDDLLDVSRVTRGLVELEMTSFDLRSAVRAAIEQVRPLIEQRGHTLATRLGPQPVWIRGDQTRVTQVVANLLNNAAKYTPQGGNVSLETRRRADCAVVAVTDDGIGMSPDLVPKVFELFTQAERTPDRGQGGLGIGLALVRSLMDLHGGRVTAETAGVGKGSTFTIELPLVDAPADVPSTTAAEEHTPQHPLDVVIVDDNRDAAETTAELLQSVGHRVRVFHSAEALLNDPGGLDDDLFVLDLGLPGMSGYELASTLRARGIAATLFAVSGYGQVQDRTRSGQAGFDQHFVKPLAPHLLLQAVGRTAAQRPYADWRGPAA